MFCILTKIFIVFKCSIERKSIFYSNIGYDNAYLQVYINLDPQLDLYQRTVYSFLDMLGFIGGIFELLKIFGYLTVSYFIKRNYYSSILSKLYHVESDKIVDDKENKTKNEDILFGANLGKSSLNNKELKVSQVAPKVSDKGSSFSSNSKKSNMHEEIKSEINSVNASYI